MGKSFLSLCLFASICYEYGEAGLAFKAGLVKGALKGLFKGQSQGKEEERCEVKWEEVWKPVCQQHFETQCRNEPQQQCQVEERQECWTKMDKNVQQRRKECATLSISSNVQLSMRKNVGQRLSKSAPNRKNALTCQLPIHPILLRQKVLPFLPHQKVRPFLPHQVSSAVLKVRGQSMKMWKFLMKTWKLLMLI